MASTYSSNLRLELIGTGEQQGTWGATTNSNLGTLLEQAIGGYESITVSDVGDTTLTTANGSADQARNMTLNLIGTIGAARNVICPSAEKVYIVKNATTGGFAVTFKVTGQTGVSVPNGSTVILYVDGTDARLVSQSPVPITLGGTGATTATAAATNLGLGTGDSPQFAGVNIGNASDTTLTRVSGGVIGVEGKPVVMTTGGQTIEHALGAVGTPSITATGDTNTGFWFPTADTIAASTDGSERMRINSNGFVGIGATSPAALFDVFNTQNNTSYQELTVVRQANNPAGTNHSRLSFGQISTNSMFVEAANQANVKGNLFLQPYGGSVIIGPTYDIGSLAVSTDRTTVPLSQAWRGMNGNTFENDAYLSWTGAVTQFGNFQSFPLTFVTDANERMRIDESGNVGIGTPGGDYGRTWRFVVRQDQNATTQIGVINVNTGANAIANIVKTTGTGNSLVDWSLADNSGSPYDNFSYGSAVQSVRWAFGGTERMRIDSSGNLGLGTTSPTQKLDVTGNINASGTLAMGSSFLRNRIINGAMQIDQRNSGAAVTMGISSVYGADRWQSNEDTDGAMTVQQSTTTPPTGFTHSMLFTTTLADATLAAGQFTTTQQKIEGLNVFDLGWGAAGALSVTVSFWVRSSLTGTFSGALQNSAQDRSYPFSYTISAANTWEQKTVTIPGDTSGTWLKDTGAGLRVIFDLGCGSSLRGTAGAWAASGVFGVTGAVSVISTLSATWAITGVQLEAGSVATPFERRQYGQELMLCQRYYETAGNYNLFSGDVSISQIYYNSVRFAVPKRIAPTVTPADVANSRFGAVVPTISIVTTDGFYAQKTSTSSGPGYFQYSWTASSEL